MAKAKKTADMKKKQPAATKPATRKVAKPKKRQYPDDIEAQFNGSWAEKRYFFLQLRVQGKDVVYKVKIQKGNLEDLQGTVDDLVRGFA